MILLQDVVQILDRSVSAAAAQGSFRFQSGNRRAVETGLISVDDAALGAMQYGARGVIDFQEIKRLNDALYLPQQRDVVSAHCSGKFYNRAADADAAEHLEHGGAPMGVAYTMRAPRRFGGWDDDIDRLIEAAAVDAAAHAAILFAEPLERAASPPSAAWWSIAEVG